MAGRVVVTDDTFSPQPAKRNTARRISHPDARQIRRAPGVKGRMGG
jgi:hypothetical protein